MRACQFATLFQVAELPMLYEPFDRMPVAQASVEPMLLLTNDETLRGYGSFVTVE
jgi:PIN domain nuclease of toxin-antitoxin system